MPWLAGNVRLPPGFDCDQAFTGNVFVISSSQAAVEHCQPLSEMRLVGQFSTVKFVGIRSLHGDGYNLILAEKHTVLLI